MNVLITLSQFPFDSYPDLASPQSHDSDRQSVVHQCNIAEIIEVIDSNPNEENDENKKMNNKDKERSRSSVSKERSVRDSESKERREHSRGDRDSASRDRGEMGPPRERTTTSTPRRSIDPDHSDRDPKRRRGGEERAKESPPKLDRLEKKEKAKREKERKEKEGKEEKETSSKKEKKRVRNPLSMKYHLPWVFHFGDQNN